MEASERKYFKMECKLYLMVPEGSSRIKMYLLDLDAGTFSVALKVEAAWYWAGKYERKETEWSCFKKVG